MKANVIQSIVKKISVAFFLLLAHSSSTQINGYIIESFQSEYHELQEYQSIGILTSGNPLWEYEFNLDFIFPIFDTSFSSIFYENGAWSYFTEDQNDGILAMFNFIGYEYDHILDTSNIESDVRFSYIEEGDISSFVLQFTKVRFFADPFEDSLDTYMNFQIWLKENGVLEVHFGEMHMDDTPIYDHGRGFYCYTTSGGVDTSEVCGPHMGISHPLNPDIAIGLQGAYDEYEVTEDVYSILTVLPPEGWIIRFKPMSVSTTEPHNSYNHVVISPNPATSQIRIPQTDGRVMISDATERAVWRGMVHDDGTIDISSFPPGIYFLQQINLNGISTGKFVKE